MSLKVLPEPNFVVYSSSSTMRSNPILESMVSDSPFLCFVFSLFSNYTKYTWAPILEAIYSQVEHLTKPRFWPCVHMSSKRGVQLLSAPPQAPLSAWATTLYRHLPMLLSPPIWAAAVGATTTCAKTKCPKKFRKKGELGVLEQQLLTLILATKIKIKIYV